ncbi:metallophosphoesterase [Patescibacteria group bacterium]|nr:metallophosphoesterase [Patescibacteria group bacterium]
MNYYSITILGFILVSVVLSAILWRDRKNDLNFFGRHKKLALICILFLCFVAITAFYTRYIEPNAIQVKEITVGDAFIKKSISIAFIADLQINKYTKPSWIEKIFKEMDAIKPDIVIYGGDMISNEGNAYDPIHMGSATYNGEIEYLRIFKPLIEKYPSYFILGNHECGIGNLSRSDSRRWTGDLAKDVTEAMIAMGAKPLINGLDCPEVDNQKICFFGIDDIWLGTINFEDLDGWTTSTPLIFLSHNPDGILYWPKEIKKPDLVLSGHTHGGQIYLPFIGPLGNAGVELGKKYYRGLNYYEDIPIYTSIGLGESGGPVRFMSAPELTVINIAP